MDKPLLLVDIDGVISLFGFDPGRAPDGRYLMVDGIVHFISATAGEHLRSLWLEFELVWCSGWEEKANDYLPSALGLPAPPPYLTFPSGVTRDRAHWKLHAIDSYAGARRPLAWIDDAHDQRCRDWARARAGATLLVSTDTAVGITGEHVDQLLAWAISEPVSRAAAR